MKRVLVLSLVLVMALGSIAFADVNFSGSFKAEIANGGEKFLDDLGVNGTLTVNIGASAGDDANWSFEADSSIRTVLDEDDNLVTKFDLGKYLLKLDDQYFDLYFWGKGKELADKSTTLGLITAGKKAASGHRARLVVDAVEPVTLTTDFTDNALYVFADATVAGYDAGLAYKRSGAIADKDAKNTVGIWGKADIDMFTIQGDVAATLGVEKPADEDDEDAEAKKGIALGYGAKVSAEVTDEVSVYAQYRGMQDGFDAGDWKKSELALNATYEETAVMVAGTFTMDLAAESNTLKAEAYYRFSDTVAYSDLFKADKYYTNDAPAVGLVANLKDFGIEDVTLNVASPVVEDLVWARAYAKYIPGTEEADDDDEGDKVNNFNFEVGAFAHVKATDKLTIDPSVIYKTENSVIDLKADAKYLIGTSEDVALSLTVQKVMAEEGAKDDKGNAIAKEVLKAGVEVKF